MKKQKQIKYDSEESNDGASNWVIICLKSVPPSFLFPLAVLGYVVSKFVGKWLRIQDRWKQHFKEQLIVFIQSDTQGLACIKAKRKKEKRKKAG